MNQAPSFIKPRDPASAPSDKLQALKTLAAQARDLEMEKKTLEERLDDISRQLNNLTTKTLPDAMDELGLNKIAIEAEGNLPPYELKCQPFYSANIAASWDPARKAQAFNWLDENGHGDLIKTEVNVVFPREERERAKDAASLLSDQGYAPSLKQNVHAQTLSAFAREMIESGKPLPLEVLGISVGRIVKIKEQKS